MNEKSLSIVLPCYNEEESVAHCMEQILQWQQASQGKIFDRIEIIVVDDGSTDSSLQQLKSFQHLIKLFSFDSNQGYGAALKHGFRNSTGRLIAFYDFDQTCHPADLENLGLSLLKNEADLVLGRRLHNHSQMPLHRNLGNKLYSTMLKWFLGSSLTDVCTGFRVFDAKWIPLFSDGLPNDLNYSLAMTIIALKKNLKVIEKKIHYGDRGGTSKLNSFRHGLQFLFTTLAFSLRKSRP